MSLVKWDVVCLPQDVGGLGIKSSKHANIISMAKLQWMIMTQPQVLRVQILRQKYNIFDVKFFDKNVGSHMLKSICKGTYLFRKGIQWIPGTESSISFLHDPWLDGVPLDQVLFGLWWSQDLDIKIKDCWDFSSWNLSFIPYDIPDGILKKNPSHFSFLY